MEQLPYRHASKHPELVEVNYIYAPGHYINIPRHRDEIERGTVAWDRREEQK